MFGLRATEVLIILFVMGLLALGAIVPMIVLRRLGHPWKLIVPASLLLGPLAIGLGLLLPRPATQRLHKLDSSA